MKGGVKSMTYNAVAPWDKHSEGECSQDGATDDAKDTKGCLQHTGQVFDQEHHTVGQGPIRHGQDFGDDDLFLLSKLGLDVAHDEILHSHGSKGAGKGENNRWNYMQT